MFAVGSTIRESLPLNFVGKLYTALTDFDSLTIQGKLKDDAKVVNIALKPVQSRENSNLDILIDIPKKSIKLGHMIQNKIINEDFETRFMARYRKGKKGEVILQPGNMFTVQIILCELQFSIAVNDDRIFQYTCDMERFQSLDIVEVRGDVQYLTEFDTRHIFPIAIPATQYRTPNNAFSLELQRLLQPGVVIVVDAVVEGPDDGMFTVYFPSSFRLRTLLWFGADFATKTIGRKAMDENMKYVNETYDGPFPIELGQPFRMAFGIGNNEFALAVNGKPFPSYPYPIQVEGTNEPMFNMLMGLKVIVKNGLRFAPIATFIETSGDPHMLSNPSHRIII